MNKLIQFTFVAMLSVMAVNAKMTPAVTPASAVLVSPKVDVHPPHGPIIIDDIAAVPMPEIHCEIRGARKYCWFEAHPKTVETAQSIWDDNHTQAAPKTSVFGTLANWASRLFLG